MKNRIYHYLIKYFQNKFSRVNKFTFNLDMELGLNGLSLDSIEIMSLFFDLEELFKIEIRPEDYYNIKTINQLVDYIENALKIVSASSIFSLHDDRIAIVDGEIEITYSSLSNKIKTLSCEFAKLGMKSEDTVLIGLKNCWQYAVVFFAVMECGAVPVLVDFTARKEWNEIANDSKVTYILCQENCDLSDVEFLYEYETVNLYKRDLITGVEDKNEVLKQAVLIHYTSGSTGTPNGVVNDIISYQNMVVNFRQALPILNTDVMLMTLPISHGYGLSCVFLSGLFSGAKLIFMGEFNAISAIENINKHNVTCLFAVPPMLELVYKALKIRKLSINSVRYCCSSSLKISYSLIKSFYDLTSIVINQEYGSAETGVISFSTFTQLPEAAECVGKLLYEDYYEILDDNELTVFSPEMAIGYSNGMPFPKRYLTKDIVEIKDDLLYLVDRKKNLLEAGGKKVFASEVSNRMLSTGLFEDAFVTNNNTDSPSYIIAFVVLKDKKAKLTKADVVSLLLETMDSYKVPKEFFIVDKIEENSIGKVTQKCIQEMKEKSNIL